MSEEVKELKKNTGWHKFVREYSIILVAVGLIIVATILGGSTFMNGQNFINIFRNNTVLGIIAFGMAFVIITGNIDARHLSRIVWKTGSEPVRMPPPVAAGFS